MRNRNLERKNDWGTPTEVYDKLNDEFNFNFDPCPLNHDMSWDGLLIEWKERNFINPPYSTKEKEAFIMKAIAESEKGNICVMLLPVSTSSKIFHEHIQPKAKEIRFVKGRIKFKGTISTGEISIWSATHDSMVVIFRP